MSCRLESNSVETEKTKGACGMPQNCNAGPLVRLLEEKRSIPLSRGSPDIGVH